MCKPLGQEHAEGMTDRDRDDFLAWGQVHAVRSGARFLNGDAAPRRAIWSRNEPMSILGALRNAYGQHEVDDGFTFLRGGCGETRKTLPFVLAGIVGKQVLTLRHQMIVDEP
jgi:hypothetical protein